jgi:plastocyanin domain-containing protein
MISLTLLLQYFHAAQCHLSMTCCHRRHPRGTQQQTTTNAVKIIITKTAIITTICYPIIGLELFMSSSIWHLMKPLLNGRNNNRDIR